MTKCSKLHRVDTFVTFTLRQMTLPCHVWHIYWPMCHQSSSPRFTRLLIHISCSQWPTFRLLIGLHVTSLLVQTVHTSCSYYAMRQASISSCFMLLLSACQHDVAPLVTSLLAHVSLPYWSMYHVITGPVVPHFVTRFSHRIHAISHNRYFDR